MITRQNELILIYVTKPHTLNHHNKITIRKHLIKTLGDNHTIERNTFTTKKQLTSTINKNYQKTF